MQRIVDALYRVHRLIAAMTDHDTLLERIMEESKAVANAEAGSLLLYDAEKEELYFRVALGERGDQQALKREIRLKLNEGIAGAAAVSRSAVNVEDAQEDPRFFRQADEATQFQTRSLLAVPMIDRGDLVGVIEVINKEGGGPFTSLDIRAMEMFAALAATSIVNARLIEDNLRAERLAAIGQAVAGLAHYTKNLVTGMMSSVDVISQSLEMNRTDVLEKTWPIFRRSARRISDVVEDMLAYSKPRRPQREICDLARIIEDVRDTYWSLTVQQNFQFESDLDGLSAPLYADPKGVYRALLNLFVNATEAAPKEGGKVTVRAWTDGARNTLIEVSDNGPGAPPDIQEKIFEPFYSTKGSGGTGLGLAVTSKIASEHGGHVTVENGPDGTGAAFRLTIPPPDMEGGDTAPNKGAR